MNVDDYYRVRIDGSAASTSLRSRRLLALQCDREHDGHEQFRTRAAVRGQP